MTPSEHALNVKLLIADVRDRPGMVFGTAKLRNLWNTDLLFRGALEGAGASFGRAFMWWAWFDLGGYPPQAPLGRVREAVVSPERHADVLSDEEEALACELYCDLLDRFMDEVARDAGFLQRAEAAGVAAGVLR